MLKKAFESMEFYEDVIFTLGNTGCGKSTLLNSLILGSNALKTKVIEEDN